MTGGANFTRLIYPYASSGSSRLTRVTVGLKLDRVWLALRIYDTTLVFVCSICMCVCVCTSEKKKKKKTREREEAQGKPGEIHLFNNSQRG